MGKTQTAKTETPITPEVASAVIEVKAALAPAAPVKMSAVNKLMVHIPRVIASAVEQGHAALLRLRESATKYAQATAGAHQAQAELLLDVLTDVQACLKARKAGAKQVKNAEIDRMMIEAGFREPRPVYSKAENGARIMDVGHKAGSSRIIQLVVFQTPELWTSKNQEALSFWKANGITFEQNGKNYHEPFDAILDGFAYTVVSNIWAGAVRSYYSQVAPTVPPTAFETLAKKSLGLSLDERKALVAALGATIPATETVPTA